MLTAALGIVTLAFSFSFSPPEAFVFADKFGHGIMYFATFFSLLLAAVWRPGRGNGPFPSRGLSLALAVIAAGLVVEILQEVATADRHAQIGDVLLEVSGAFAALAVHSCMPRRACVAGGVPPPAEAAVPATPLALAVSGCPTAPPRRRSRCNSAPTRPPSILLGTAASQSTKGSLQAQLQDYLPTDEKVVESTVEVGPGILDLIEEEFGRPMAIQFLGARSGTEHGGPDRLPRAGPSVEGKTADRGSLRQRLARSKDNATVVEENAVVNAQEGESREYSATGGSAIPASGRGNRRKRVMTDRAYRTCGKRAFDAAAAAVALVALAPVMALVAICILIDDSWPVFFRRQRLGRGGAGFEVLKFPQHAGGHESRTIRP